MDEETKNYIKLLNQKSDQLKNRALKQIEDNKIQMTQSLTNLELEEKQFDEFYQKVENNQKKLLEKIEEEIENYQGNLIELKNEKANLQSIAFRLQKSVNLFEPEFGGQLKKILLADFSNETTHQNQQELIQQVQFMNKKYQRINQENSDQQLFNLDQLNMEYSQYKKNLFSGNDVDVYYSEGIGQNNFSRDQQEKRTTYQTITSNRNNETIFNIQNETPLTCSPPKRVQIETIREENIEELMTSLKKSRKLPNHFMDQIQNENDIKKRVGEVLKESQKYKDRETRRVSFHEIQSIKSQNQSQNNSQIRNQNFSNKYDDEYKQQTDNSMKNSTEQKISTFMRSQKKETLRKSVLKKNLIIRRIKAQEINYRIGFF